MPSTLGITGTARTLLVSGVGMMGTSAADRTSVSASDVGGSGAADVSVCGPWFDATRRNGCRVLLGTSLEDISGLLGSVEITAEVGTIPRTATFELLDSRAAYFVSDSFSRGGQPVQIWMRVNEGGEWLAFQGLTEAASNEGPYCPRATFRAVSVSATFVYGAVGCIQELPFAGRTRANLLEEFADSAGTPLTIAAPSSTISKAVDLSGLSVGELLERWGLVEGWYIRESSDGGVEILDEETFLLAVPSVNLTPDLYLSVREDPPNRPATEITVSGTRPAIGTQAVEGGVLASADPPITETSSETWTDADGYHWSRDTVTITRFGAVQSEKIEEWSDVPLAGVTPIVIGMRPSRTETIDYTYATVSVALPSGPVLVPTGQLTEIVRSVASRYSRLSSVGYTWSDGTVRLNEFESMMETERETTTFTYGSAPGCERTSVTVTLESFYNPLYVTGYDFVDGTHRLYEFYSFMEISRTTQTFASNRNTVEAGAALEIRLTETATLKKWDGKPNESYRVTRNTVTVQSGKPGGTTHQVRVTDSDMSRNSISTVAGSMTLPETYAIDVPVYSEQLMTFTLSILRDIYPLVRSLASNEDAETFAELERVARRQARSDCAVRLTVSAPSLPSLNVWDWVSITDEARNLDEKAGYVEKIAWRLDLLNGWSGMDIVLVIPPEDV